jgi:sugar lactone lactonase YvrE
VVNSEQGTILRIPILEGGEAGEPEVIIEQLPGLDGICLDLRGRIYGAQGMMNKVIQIDPADGTITELASRSDGLEVPASLAFGTRDNEPESLFVTNYAAAWWSSSPGVVRLELDVPGLPLP